MQKRRQKEKKKGGTPRGGHILHFSASNLTLPESDQTSAWTRERTLESKYPLEGLGAVLTPV